MPRIVINPTTWKAVKSYERPSGGMARNGIGVVALAAVNGRGAKALFDRRQRRSRIVAQKERGNMLRMNKGKASAAQKAHRAAFAKAVKLARKEGMGVGQALALIKGGKGGKRKSAAKAPKKAAKTKHRRKPVVMKVYKRFSVKARKARKGKRGSAKRKAQKYRSFKGRRVTGTTKVGFVGRGTVTYKSGRKRRTDRVNSYLAVVRRGRSMQLMYKNPGKKKSAKKGSKKSKKAPRYESETALTQGPLSPKDNAFLASIAHLPKAERMKAAQKYWARTYPSRFRKVPLPRQYRSIPTMLGGYKVRRDRKGRTVYGAGRKRPPAWAIKGAPSPWYEQQFPEDFAEADEMIARLRGERASSIEQRAMKNLERAKERAARVLKEGDMYTPNRRRKGKRKAGKKARRGKRRMTAAQRRALMKAVRASARKRRKAKKSGKKSRRSSRRRYRRNGSAMVANRRRRRSHGKRRHGKRRSMRRNKRRHGRRRRMFGRRMRRNFAFAALVPAFKTGLYVFGGLAAHRVLSMALDEFALSKVSALSSGPVAPYRSLISSLLVAAIGVPTVFKFLPARSLEVSGGMAASVLLDVAKVVLMQTGLMASVGRYVGMAGIPSVNTRGYGSYELSGFGAAPYAQAAAGFGYDPTPVQAMAAAPYAQAAAGYGEYESVNGLGEYTLDGIHGDQASAEAALNAADAMATPVQALADVPMVDTEFTPRMPQAAVAGFGAGIFDSTTVLPDLSPLSRLARAGRANAARF